VRIVVEPSDYVFRNAGDAAMITVALDRLRAVFPDASIQVLTNDAAGLRSIRADVEPLDAESANAWRADGVVVRRAPSFVANAGHRLRRKFPGSIAALASIKARVRRTPTSAAYRHAIHDADLVVVTGMGGITDAFGQYARGILETLELAMEAGAATAMMGQGFGPLRDARLRARAAPVLRRVDLIALRESRRGRAILDSMNVAADRIVTTGDDAIELAYERRPGSPGTSLGVNIRASSYSGVDRAFAASLGPLFAAAATRHETELIPLPISRYRSEDDLETISAIIGHRSGADVTTPQGVIDEIKRCRVIVAGSYHAAVFALSMGIPVVALAASEYYVDKFLGLADHFGCGCRTLRLPDEHFTAKLSQAIDESWSDAESLRPKLLHAATEQIAAGKVAYARLPVIVKEHRATQA